MNRNVAIKRLTHSLFLLLFVQFQFLSMKLSAASTFHDFHSDTDAFESLQVLKFITLLLLRLLCWDLVEKLGLQEMQLNIINLCMQRAKAYEAQKMQRVARRGYEEGGGTQFGPLDLTFGSYPTQPYNS